MLRFLLLCLALSLEGCLDVHALSTSLTERQVTSCLYLQGGYGLFAQVRVVTATGGADLATCLRMQ